MRFPFDPALLDRLVDVRLSNNMTAEQMADFCDCTARSIYKFESGAVQSMNTFVHYLYLMDTEELKVFITAAVMSERGVMIEYTREDLRKLRRHVNTINRKRGGLGAQKVGPT